MILRKSKEINLIIDRKKGNESLHSILLTETNELVATDGNMIAILHPELEEGDTPGRLPPEAIKEAKKQAGRHAENCVIDLTADDKAKLQNGATFSRDSSSYFPDWKRCIPDTKEHTFRTGLNVNLLLRLAKSIGANDSMVELVFNPEKPEAPIVVKGTGSGEDYGVIMPCRI